MTSNNLFNLCFPSSERHPTIDELFSLVGIRLPVYRDLYSTNAFLQEESEKRATGFLDVRMSGELGDGIFWDVFSRLDLFQPVSLPNFFFQGETGEDIKHIDLLVIPGGQYHKMYNRLHGVLRTGAWIKNILILANKRQATEDEAELIGKYINVNEGTMAFHLLQNVALPTSVDSIKVLITSDTDKGHARTDETVEHMIETHHLDDKNIVLALDHPGGRRQALAFRRIMNDNKCRANLYPHIAERSPEQLLTPGKVLDELSKLIWELVQVGDIISV